jgi:hypothetical protein
MFPEWFMKPESIFRTVLWFFGPFFAWFIGKIVIRRVEAWHASRTELTAKATLPYLYRLMDNPPTLLSSVAYLVCFLPLPIFLTSLLFTLYFSPSGLLPAFHSLDPHLAENIRNGIFSFLFFCNYGLFGVLAVYGIKVAYWLRHGEARFAENYRAGVQKRIDRLKKKFPQLSSFHKAD